jgi:TolB-like protein/DNA-binding winged helix-turn-helix (wHTH) protein/Tfp pilus assembly protein PilF
MLAVNSHDQISLFDGFTLDLARGCVTRSDEQIHLRPQTYEVLRYLVANRGHLISKDKLIEEVWKGRAVTDGSLGKCIEELRDALGPEAKQFIRNVRGRGYIFDKGAEDSGRAHSVTTQSEQIDVVRVTVEDQEEDPEVIVPKALPRAIAPLRSTNRLKITAVAAAGALIMIIAAIIGYRALTGSASEPGPIRSVAVLPFKNESGKPDVEYLSDGMTESLINGLSQASYLSVKAHSSVSRYKGKEIEPQKVAAELSVQAILTGRVVQRGDNLTLYLSLVDGRDGNQIWGEQYDRSLANLVALQNEIGRDVLQKLRVQLSSADVQKVARNYTQSVDAFQLYLKGRHHIGRNTPSEIQRGISHLQQATEIDPNYALAYVALAGAYLTLALNSEMPATEVLPKAKAAASRAVEIDDTLAEAHAELGNIIFWYDWNWSLAETQLKRALQLNPNSAATSMEYAAFLSNTGRYAESIPEIKRAVGLDPLDPTTRALEGIFLIRAGQVDEGLVALQKTLEAHPNHWPAHLFAVSGYLEKRMFDEAVAAARKAKAIAGITPQTIAFLAYTLAKSGKRAEAQSALEELLELSNRRYVSPKSIAMVYQGLGERDEAISWLERAYEVREPRLTLLKVERGWDNLRDDRRFQDLLRRMRLNS